MPRSPKSDFEKSSEDLVDLFAALAPHGAGVEQKQMFGWSCCFVNGNLFTGLHKQSMVLRLSEKDHAALMKQPGAAPFEPMPGRAMRGYVALANPLTLDRSALRDWIGRSLKYTATLPAKTKKTKAAKKNSRDQTG